MIPKPAFTPIVIALVVATLLTAFWSFLDLYDEFHRAKWIVDSHPPLPYPAALLGTIYPFIWFLPLLTLAFAIILRRRTEIPVTLVSWFVSSVGLALFIWFLLIAES